MNYLLFNPKARNGMAAEDLAMIHKALQGQQIREYNLIDYKDYSVILKDVRPEDIVYLVGGDGTLNHFINDMNKLDLSCDVYFYSAGTGNDFKRDIDPEGRAYRVKINKYIKQLPTVIVNDKEYKFINGIGFGIDGYCCVEGDRRREISKSKINYTSIALKGILGKYKPCNAKITVDGVVKEYKKVWFAATMFGKCYGGGMMVAPNQSRFNSEHTVCNVVMHNSGRLGVLMKFSNVFKGKHLRYTNLFAEAKGHIVEVEFDRPCCLQIDGESFENITKYKVIYE